ncbi:hypothetical protein DEA8626_02790 [Defluviimonas aquaemixtae]|uniref:Cytochrome c domain-containing protein n=1 Tax=Albidovulum aquaemixtae TaxID=1542388 RepID=A0A2R8BK87_9RHOB|nr:cytochrome c [Defluviimonas aquaemixtae]SPH23722.1 hypothetical protein DEA8626_02790 [Defluviimonas aquaemixtae]
MRRIRVLVTGMLLNGLLAWTASAQDVDIGAELYTDYCAACHGASGMGDGDMANMMTIPAPNLTLLASENDGDFPMLKMIHIIDGRTGVRAHGGPMPVFGRVFDSDGMGPENPYGSVLEVRGRVLSLALYLESIQK